MARKHGGGNVPAGSEQPGDLHEPPFWKLLIHEDRLHSERTTFFLLANSFLVTGFAVLRQEAEHGIQFVPIAVGILFSLFHLANINYGEKTRAFWEGKLKGSSGASRAALDERDAEYQKTGG